MLMLTRTHRLALAAERERLGGTVAAFAVAAWLRQGAHEREVAFLRRELTHAQNEASTLVGQIIALNHAAGRPASAEV